MAKPRPTIEDLHEQSMESKISLRVAAKHVATANEALTQLLAEYNKEPDAE